MPAASPIIDLTYMLPSKMIETSASTKLTELNNLVVKVSTNAFINPAITPGNEKPRQYNILPIMVTFVGVWKPSLLELIF